MTTVDPVELERQRGLLDEPRPYTATPPPAARPGPANVVDVRATPTGLVELQMWDAKGALHQCPLTPARAAGLIRRLAGYLSAQLEGHIQ